MASRLFNPSCILHGFRTPLFAAGFGVSSALLLASPLLQQYRTRHALRLDSSPSTVNPKDWSFSQYQEDARVPVVRKRGGLNPGAVKQFSAGSIIGLVAGLGVSVFSKSLAFLIGVAVVAVQTAESYGIHIVPYRRLQRYFKSVDLRSAVQDNIAFKISFGAMFALSAFAEF